MTHRFAVCYAERHGKDKWCVVTAETAREAVETVKRHYPGYEVKECYKEQKEWKWK